MNLLETILSRDSSLNLIVSNVIRLTLDIFLKPQDNRDYRWIKYFRVENGNWNLNTLLHGLFFRNHKKI